MDYIFSGKEKERKKDRLSPVLWLLGCFCSFGYRFDSIIPRLSPLRLHEALRFSNFGDVENHETIAIIGGEKSESNRTPAWIAGRPAGLQPVEGTFPFLPTHNISISTLHISNKIMLLLFDL